MIPPSVSVVEPEARAMNLSPISKFWVFWKLAVPATVKSPTMFTLLLNVELPVTVKPPADMFVAEARVIVVPLSDMLDPARALAEYLGIWFVVSEDVVTITASASTVIIAPAPTAKVEAAEPLKVVPVKPLPAVKLATVAPAVLV